MRPISLLAVALILLSAPPSRAADTRTAPSRTAGASRLSEVSQAVEALAAKVSPAVVEIVVSGGGARQSGSGVLISPRGEIVTNNHVVAGGKRVVVTIATKPEGNFPGQSTVKPVGRRLDAVVVGVDPETDLALLQVEIDNAPHLTFGDSDNLQPGHLVVAVGSPLGLENSVTLGVVSAVGRQLEQESRMAWIQTDAPINPGNSGGALVNGAGELIGINTLIMSRSGGSEGVGFAVPAHIARDVVSQLRTNGVVRRGDVGAVTQTITPTLAAGLGLSRTWGVILADVRPGSPADAAGLKPGDLVVEVDGKPMENGRQLDVNLYRRAPGSVVQFHIERAGNRRTVPVTVSERPRDPARFAAMVSRGESAVPRLAIQALELDPNLATLVPWVREPNGVIVARLMPGGPWSEDGGLEAGDVIHRVNGKPVATLAALRTAVDAQAARSPLVFHVNRGGELRYVTVELE